MHIEPVDMEFEAACAHLVGGRRKGESAVDLMHRVVRVRELLRAEAALSRVRDLADEYEQNPNWREWGIHSRIRRALGGAA